MQEEPLPIVAILTLLLRGMTATRKFLCNRTPIRNIHM
jgi:hypothetical protein